MKIFKLILLVFIIFLAIDYFGRSPLIKEIAELESPVDFLDEVRFDLLAQKYVPLGSPKEQVINQLESYGFTIYQRNKATELLECWQCDDVFITAIYDFKLLFLLPTLRSVINVGFKNGYVFLVKGVYVSSGALAS